MKTLTLWQPWATWIALYGKDVENRKWPPPRWLIGRDLAIHAGKRWDPDAFPFASNVDPPDDRSAYPFGSVVAVARVAWAAHPDRAREAVWKIPGQWGWMLEDVRALAAPVACKGAQGLWSLPESVEAQVRAQLEEAG